VIAIYPGLMPGTGLAREYPASQPFAWNDIPPVIRPISRSFISMNSAGESGRALARLVPDPAEEGISGKYYSGREEKPSSKESYNAQKALELWEAGANMVNRTEEENLLPASS
jgi:hypothetical protein